MAGLFPEYLSYMKCSGLIHHKDFLVDYVKAGKRSYGIVATYQDPGDKEPPALFQSLSTNFELCVAGLGFVRLDLDRMQNPSNRQAKRYLLKLTTYIFSRNFHGPTHRDGNACPLNGSPF